MGLLLVCACGSTLPAPGWAPEVESACDAAARGLVPDGGRAVVTSYVFEVQPEGTDDVLDSWEDLELRADRVEGLACERWQGVVAELVATRAARLVSSERVVTRSGEVAAIVPNEDTPGGRFALSVFPLRLPNGWTHHAEYEVASGAVDAEPIQPPTSGPLGPSFALFRRDVGLVVMVTTTAVPLTLTAEAGR